MRIFLKHIMRNIKENIGRTSLILVSLFGVGLLISISLGLCFSCRSLWDSMAKTVMGGYNFIAESTTEEDITEERINKLGIKFEKLGMGELNYGYIQNDKDEFISSPLLGLDLEQAFNMNLIELNNNKTVKLFNNEVIISNTFANKNKLKVDDKFEYYDENGRIHSLKIRGIAKDSGPFLSDLCIVSSKDTFLKINGEEDIKYDYFLLKYNGKRDLKELSNELNNIEDDYGLDFVFEEKPSLMEIFGNFLKIGIIAILFILVVVYFTLNSIVKIIISERIPIIGSFRSVGASISKMNSILLMEMATYGIIGGFLGALLGVGFTKVLFMAFEMVDEMLGITIEMQSFETYGLLIVIFTVILLVLFQISLSISEILKSSKLSIKECIFNKHESIYKYSSKKFLVGLCAFIISLISLIFSSRLNFFFSVISILALFISIAFLLPSITKYLSNYLDRVDNPVLHMAKNTIVNNKLQINTNVIVAVMMCVALISFAILNYSTSSYKDKLDLFNTDLYVISSEESESVTNELRNIDNVESVSVLYTDDFASYYHTLKFANNVVDELTLIYSDNYEMLMKDTNTIDVDHKLATNLKENEIIVSDYFKEKYKLKVGDIVVLNGIKKEERFTVEIPLNLKVVGFANTNNVNAKSIILSENLIDDTVTVFSTQEYFITYGKDAKTKEIKKEISRALTDTMATVQTKKQYIELTKETMKELYVILVEIILAIIAVALIGIINNQSVSFLERKREMAVLYSTAMSRSQLNKMIFIEVFLSFIISSLISIIFTIMLIYLLRQIFMLLGFFIPIKFSIASILILMFVIGIIMIVIYLVMKRKIKKMNIVEELKYE